MAVVEYTGADGFKYRVIDGTSLYISEEPGTVGTLTNITAIQRGILTLEDQTTVDLSGITFLAINDPHHYQNHRYTLGNYAFKDCSSLTTASISGVDTLGHTVFQYCYELEQVYNPYITSVPDHTFEGCYALFRANLPNVIEIGVDAFINTSLEGLPSNIITTIGGGAFMGISTFENLYIPETVTTIGYGAFEHCYNVRTLHFYGSKPTMDTECFAFGLWNHQATVDVTDSAGGWTADGGLELYSNQYTTFNYQTEPTPPIDETLPIEFVSNVNVYGNLHIRNGTILDDGLSLPKKISQQELLTNIYTNMITVRHNLGEAPSSVLLFLVTNTGSGKLYTQILADVSATDEEIQISFSTLPPYGSKLLIKALI